MTIQELLMERIEMHKRKYEDYKNAYVSYAQKMEHHQVLNAYNFMHQEHAIIIELEILLDKINESKGGISDVE